jgi:hypothetical protein
VLWRLRISDARRDLEHRRQSEPDRLSAWLAVRFVRRDRAWLCKSANRLVGWREPLGGGVLLRIQAGECFVRALPIAPLPHRQIRADCPVRSEIAAYSVLMPSAGRGSAVSRQGAGYLGPV